MKGYINSKDEKVEFRDELVVEVKINHSERVECFKIGGFKKHSGRSMNLLNEFLLMLERLDSIMPGSHRGYSHKRDFNHWFKFRVVDESTSISWPESLLKKDMIIFKDYAVYYYDEFGMKHSASIELELY